MLQQTWEFSGGGWLDVVVLFVLAIAIALGFAADHRQPRKLRWATLALRLCLLLWLALPLWGLAMWQVRYEPQPGRFTLLVDQSASARIRPNSQAQLAKTTLELAQALSEYGRVAQIAYLGRGSDAPWQFATTAPSHSGGPTHMLADLARLPADVGDGSEALIIISDGLDHGLATAKPVTANIAALLLPRDDDYPSSLLLTDVQTDAYALIRSPLRFTVSLRRQPGATIQNGRVQITNGDLPLGITAVSFSAGETTKTVTLDVLPTQEGRQVFTVTVGADHIKPQNLFHETRIAVRVIRDRIRILHVVGRPSWETRLLRENLRRDPAIDLVSFQILRTQRDNPNARDVELSLIPFPTKELFSIELPKFDVVVFQNFDYASYFDPALANMLLSNLRNFVVNDGGGFAMTAGDLSFGYGGYHQTVLREILPVEWRGLGQFSEGRFELTDGPWSDWFGVAAPHSQPIGRIYQSLAKPRARIVWSAAGQPVFVVGSAGRGRTAALLTDQLWKTAFLGSPSDRAAVAAFWSRLIRYLSGDPEFEDTHVQWQTPTAMPGSESRASLSPTTTSVEIINAAGQAITPPLNGQGGIQFRAPLEQTVLRARSGFGVAPEPLIVQYPLMERTSIVVNRQAWRQWAANQKADLAWLEDWQESGLLEKLRTRAQRVIHRDFLPIQEFYWYWLILITLLCGEVALRRLGGAP